MMPGAAAVAAALAVCSAGAANPDPHPSCDECLDRGGEWGLLSGECWVKAASGRAVAAEARVSRHGDAAAMRQCPSAERLAAWRYEKGPRAWASPAAAATEGACGSSGAVLRRQSDGADTVEVGAGETLPLEVVVTAAKAAAAVENCGAVALTWGSGVLTKPAGTLATVRRTALLGAGLSEDGWLPADTDAAPAPSADLLLSNHSHRRMELALPFHDGLAELLRRSPTLLLAASAVLGYPARVEMISTLVVLPGGASAAAPRQDDGPGAEHRVIVDIPLTQQSDDDKCTEQPEEAAGHRRRAKQRDEQGMRAEESVLQVCMASHRAWHGPREAKAEAAHRAKRGQKDDGSCAADDKQCPSRDSDPAGRGQRDQEDVSEGCSDARPLAALGFDLAPSSSEEEETESKSAEENSVEDSRDVEGERLVWLRDSAQLTREIAPPAELSAAVVVLRISLAPEGVLLRARSDEERRLSLLGRAHVRRWRGLELLSRLTKAAAAGAAGTEEPADWPAGSEPVRSALLANCAARRSCDACTDGGQCAWCAGRRRQCVPDLRGMCRDPATHLRAADACPE